MPKPDNLHQNLLIFRCIGVPIYAEKNSPSLTGVGGIILYFKLSICIHIAQIDKTK